tara:strand:- start:806 stop:1444 length:639 start_codon:yes stop_codon:yes gene_type:complete
MSNNFAIGIPTLNRADLLNQALFLYFKNFANTEIFIIDNGDQDIKLRNHLFKVIKPNENLGVAKSWNLLCDEIFKNHSHALILNDDIELGVNQAGINSFINNYSFDLSRCYTQFHLCSFIMSKNCFAEFRFDEDFYPAYYEDRDMLYRLKLANKSVVENYLLNPHIFRNSQTISSDGGDPSVNKNFNKLTELYIKKWGGHPNNETYTTPYNK